MQHIAAVSGEQLEEMLAVQVVVDLLLRPFGAHVAAESDDHILPGQTDRAEKGEEEKEAERRV